MRFLRPDDEEQVRSRLAQELEGEVDLLLFVQPPTGLYIPGREEPQTGRETQRLLEEVAALSPRLHLSVHNPRTERALAERYHVERTPALILRGRPRGGDGAASDPAAAVGQEQADEQASPLGAEAGTGGLVRFFGLPAGYEFAALLDDIVDVSRGRTQLSAATREAVAALPGPLHLQVFVTPT
jgi:alkyl hydroperoxide reductase subunit AhpF